jgi:hypothetical protein
MLGTAFLLAAVVWSGIMGERLAVGNVDVDWGEQTWNGSRR